MTPEEFRIFDRRATGVHEAGHALTAWLQGLAVLRMEINRDNNGGFVRHVVMVLPDELIPVYLIGILAGGISERRYWEEFSSLSYSRIERIIEVSTTTDRGIFRSLIDSCPYSESHLTTAACKIVDRCWGRILVKGDLLFRKRVLTGSSTK